MSIIKVRLRSHQIERARDFATRRVSANRSRYKGTRKERQGRVRSRILGGHVDQEFNVEFLGILAEVVIRDYFERNREVVGMLVSSFLKDSADVTDDFDIVVCRRDGSETRVSVKGTERNFVVNRRAADMDDSDVVMFARFFGDDIVFLCTFKPSDVRSWELRSGRSDYYFKRFDYE